MPIDTGLWTTWGTGTQDESGGTLNQTPSGVSGQYVGIYSNSTYNLTNKEVQAQIAQLPSSATGVQAVFRIEIDANNAVTMCYSDGQLLCQHQITSTMTNVSLQAWTANTLAFRINFDNVQSLVWFDIYVADTGWVNKFYETLPITTTALRISIATGCYQAVGSPGTTKWESTGLPIVRNLTGTSAGAATEVGQPTRRRPVTGTSVGGSTSAATIGRKKSLVGASAAGVATEVGQPTSKRRLLAASAGVAAASGNVSVYTPVEDVYGDLIRSETGLVAYWPIHETAGSSIIADAATGAAAGSPTNLSVGSGVTLGVAGIPGDSLSSAAYFNGTSNAKISGTSGELDFGGFGNFTFEWWQYQTPADISGITYGPIWEYGASGGDPGLHCWNYPTQADVYIGLVTWSLTSTGPITTDTWQHVVLTRTGGAELRIYVDGVLVSTPSDPGYVTTSGQFQIGFRESSTYGNQYRKGSIAQFAVYNVALSPTAIAAHYAIGLGGTSPATTKPGPGDSVTFDSGNALAANLKIWLAMIETSGADLADSAGTPQNGTVLGTLSRVTAPNGGQAISLTTDNNQRISLGDQPTHGLSTASNAAFSFSYWVRLNNVDFANKRLFSGGYFSDAPSMSIVPGYNLYYRYGITGGTGDPTQASFYDPGLAANTWYHIVFTDDGTNATGAVKCYVNGSALTVNTGETNYYGTGKTGNWDKNGTYGASFGAESPFGDDWHPATYDSLMIYERVLSAAEVSSLYSSPFQLLLVGGGATYKDLTGTSVGTSTSAGTATRRRSLSVTSAGISTSVGTTTRRRSLGAVSAGVGASAAVPSRRRGLAASSAGIASAAATVIRKVSLTAVSTGVAISTSAPTRRRPLLATSTGVASASGVVSKVTQFKNVSGTSVGTGVSTATATRIRPLAGSSVGGSTTVATAARQRQLTGSSTATGITTALISDKRALTAASSGTVSAAGTVRRKVALVATAPGVAAVSVTIGNRKTYNGLTVGVASASAQVRAKRLLLVTSAGSTSVTVNLQKKGSLFAASIGTSTTTATATRRRSLTVTNAGVGSSSGAPTAKRRVAVAASAGTAVTIGSLSKVGAPTFRDLLANSAGKATTTVTINATRRLTATSSGVTTVAVIFKHERNMTVATGGTSVTIAVATRRRSLVVASNGGSVCPTSFPSRKRPLTVSNAGLSSATAQVAVLHRLTGTSTGISTANAQILRGKAGIIPAPSVGTAVTTVTALYAKRALKSSNVVGYTVISGEPTTASTFLRGTVYSYSIVVGIIGRKGSMAASSAGGSSASASIRRKRYLLAICAGVAVTTAAIRVRRLVKGPNPSVGVASTVGSPSGRRNIMGVPSGPLLVNGVATTTALRPTRRRSISGACAGSATASAQVRRSRPLVAGSHGISTAYAAITNAGIVVWNGSTFAVGGTDPVVLWDDVNFSITGGGDITGWKDAEDQFVPVT